MAAAASERHADIWWVFLLQGIAAIIFGLLLLVHPAETLVVFVVFLGFYWLFLGVLELVRVFVDRSVPWYWSALLGALGILAGILVLRHPISAAIVLPLGLVIWLGILGLVIGAIEIIGAFSGGGVGSFILGIVNILIGLLLLGSPGLATLAVPFVFGILLLIEGVALVIWAFRIRD